MTLASRSLSRRSTLLAVAAAMAASAAPPLARPSGAQGGGELRVGFQKGSASLLVLKSQSALEEKLAPLGYSVSWAEFTSGPPLLKALNAGSLDFGSTGAPPPIFAQAAGADLVYALAAKPSPRTQAIVVPEGSAIATPADLAGKQVAVAKGSSAHALLIWALRSAGLDWDAVEPVYLQPADAKAAFEGGAVAAWSIWDPYYAAEEAATGARTLITDEVAGAPNRSFYLAARPFAKGHAEALAVVRDALVETDGWAAEHPAEVADMLAEQTGLDAAVLRAVEARRVYGLEPVTAAIIADQQALADVFFELELIPERIDVSSAFVELPEPAQV
jgi:sulfonate transport system substrate-binding protein